MSLFPHDKLDWTLTRLERQLEDAPDDDALRAEYAAACLSRALFHDGGEPWTNRALTQARRVLQRDPGHPAALVVAGASLVGLGRLEPARRHLDDALRIAPDDARVHHALAVWHQVARRQGDPGSDEHHAIVAAENACRLAPDAWEPHALLATLLGGPDPDRTSVRSADRTSVRSADRVSARSARRLERSQYHRVLALQRGAPGDREAALLFELGVGCLARDRLPEATKLFTRLLDDDTYKSAARYHLGLVNLRTGRFKNAVLYLRQHLDAAGDEATVYAKLGSAYLQLGEIAHARDACNRALSIDPMHRDARWVLGRALVAEERDDEAVRLFKEILEESPDHTPAFAEIVGVRARRGDRAWLKGALRSEVAAFDRLPVQGRDAAPRAATRKRLGVLLEALGSNDDAVAGILEAIDLTTDEGLRFGLWEAAVDAISVRRAGALRERLADPGRAYSAAAGREVLALARLVPEELLVNALEIDDEDLRKAAVERRGPARDVGDHRRGVDDERREARAWQALVLLALATHGARAGASEDATATSVARALLVRWAAEADADLADAANAALVLLGDESAGAALRKRARARGVENLVDAMLAQVAAPSLATPYHPIAPGEDRSCTTCGRRSGDVATMMVSKTAAICSHCLADIASQRRALETDDPEVVCALTGKGTFETAAMYVYKGTAVCREVVDQGLGVLEREAVDRYLAAL